MKHSSENWYFESSDGKAYFCWGERLLPVTAANVTAKGMKPFERDRDAEPKQQGFGPAIAPQQFRWLGELELADDVLPHGDWVRLFGHIASTPDRAARLPIAGLSLTLAQGEDGWAPLATSCYVSLTRSGDFTTWPVGVEVMKGGAPVPLANIRIL